MIAPARKENETERHCECFGDSGLCASTFRDKEGRRCCDLCGWPIKPASPRLAGRGDWSKALVPFRIWDEVHTKVDPRHVGEVTAVNFNEITVRWPNGWTSQHHKDELEKPQ